MAFSRIVLPAVTAALLAATAHAETPAAAAPPMPAPADNGPAAGRGMMRGMFTQEERMMLFVDAFKATAGMTDDQRHAYRQQQRVRIMAMTDADRAKLKADLDARWNALPADQKAAIQAKVQDFIASHQRPTPQ